MHTIPKARKRVGIHPIFGIIQRCWCNSIHSIFTACRRKKEGCKPKGRPGMLGWPRNDLLSHSRMSPLCWVPQKGILTPVPSRTISEAQCHVCMWIKCSSVKAWAQIRWAPLPHVIAQGWRAQGLQAWNQGKAGILTEGFEQFDYSGSQLPCPQNKCNYSVVPLRVIIKFNEIIYS